MYLVAHLYSLLYIGSRISKADSTANRNYSVRNDDFGNRILVLLHSRDSALINILIYSINHNHHIEPTHMPYNIHLEIYPEV